MQDLRNIILHWFSGYCRLITSPRVSLQAKRLGAAWSGNSANYEGLSTLANDAAELRPIGEHTARLAEASDAGSNAALLVDAVMRLNRKYIILLLQPPGTCE